MDHKAYMYVLECRDGSYYTGYTTDVRRRLAVHNSGKGAKYTRARLPVKLIYAQGFASKEEAMSAEALLKDKAFLVFRSQQHVETIQLVIQHKRAIFIVESLAKR